MHMAMGSIKALTIWVTANKMNCHGDRPPGYHAADGNSPNNYEHNWLAMNSFINLVAVACSYVQHANYFGI